MGNTAASSRQGTVRPPARTGPRGRPVKNERPHPRRRGTPNTSSCRRARHSAPAGLGKSGCLPLPPSPVTASPRPSPPAPPKEADAQNPPTQTGLPVPGRPIIGSHPAASRAPPAPLRGRCAGAARPLTRPGRSHEPAAIGNREQTGSRPRPGPPRPPDQKTTTCGTRTGAGKSLVLGPAACSSNASSTEVFPTLFRPVRSVIGASSGMLRCRKPRKLSISMRLYALRMLQHSGPEGRC